MERLVGSLFEPLLDPLVLAVAVALTVVLLSGLFARLVELWEGWRPRRSLPARWSGRRLSRA